MSVCAAVSKSCSPALPCIELVSCQALLGTVPASDIRALVVAGDQDLADFPPVVAFSFTCLLDGRAFSCLLFLWRFFEAAQSKLDKSNLRVYHCRLFVPFFLTLSVGVLCSMDSMTVKRLLRQAFQPSIIPFSEKFSLPDSVSPLGVSY